MDPHLAYTSPPYLSPPLSFLSSSQLPSHPVTPSRHSESRAGSSGHTYHTLPHPSSFGTAPSSSPMWGPLEPPSTPKPWSQSCLRPAPPLRPSAALSNKEVLFTCMLKTESKLYLYLWYTLCCAEIFFHLNSTEIFK